MIEFVFNGVASTDYGCWVTEPPEIPVPAIRSETQKIIGSSKLLHYTEGDDAMDPVTVSLDCAVRDMDGDTLNALAAWLRGGGRLITPADPEHYYNAWVKNQLSLAKVLRLRGDRRFTVTFECEPFRYRFPEAAAIAMAAPGSIANPGTAPCEPLIRVNGSGSAALMIGASSLIIDDIQDYVMIDCAAQAVYRGAAPDAEDAVNWGAKITRYGDWPRLKSGINMINWTGEITDILITPRWRDF